LPATFRVGDELADQVGLGRRRRRAAQEVGGAVVDPLALSGAYAAIDV